jgi:hypothetical protein
MSEQQISVGKCLLSLHAKWHSFDGPNLNINRKVFGYRVLGLPSGQEADIVNIKYRWQILRTVDSVQSDWAGQYRNADEALAALDKQMKNAA